MRSSAGPKRRPRRVDRGRKPAGHFNAIRFADFRHDDDEYVFSFRYLYLAVAAMSFTLSAHAAGIDCSAAKTQGIVGTDDATMHSVSTFRFDR